MTQERQDQFYEQLEQLTSEQVLRAFTDWHGMQLLTNEFYENCIEEGYISSNDMEQQAIACSMLLHATIKECNYEVL